MANLENLKNENLESLKRNDESSDSEVFQKFIRNIGIIAHIDAGKTTTTERILFYTGKNRGLGEVHDGTATMDFMKQEQERGITITAAATTCKWRGATINIIDTPGHVDFTVEVERSLRVLDGAVTILDAVGGVQPQTETVWNQANKYKVPRLCFINKMDRLGAEFYKAIDSIHDRLKCATIELVMPIGYESEFKGVVDLVRMKELIWDDETLGANYTISDIRPELLEKAKLKRKELLEAVAAEDEDCLNQYFENGELSEESVKKCIRKGTIAFKFVPILCGSSFKNKCVQLLLDCIVDYLPNPLEVDPIKATTFKTNTPIDFKCEKKAPFAGLVFKLMTDPFVGAISFLRIYSGSIKKGDKVSLVSMDKVSKRLAKKSIKIGRLLRMHANEREDIEEAFAGDIIALSGLTEIRTGDTLSAENYDVVLQRMTIPTPVVERSIEPAGQKDRDTLSAALGKLSSEDPSLEIGLNPETSQTLIKGMGELHLEIIVDRLKEEFGVNVIVGKPAVAFRETIKQKAEIDYTHKKQSGGAGQFARVIMVFEPLNEELIAKYTEDKKEVTLARDPKDNSVRYIFVNNIKGGAIPTEFIPGVIQGIEHAADNGVLANFPVFNFIVYLNDGSFHDVDSSIWAFDLCTRSAFKEAMHKAKAALLEPVMKVEVTTPSDYRGSIEGDLSKRKGILEFSDYLSSGSCLINAKVPLSAMFGYADQLRSMSQGRASFSMEFSHYSTVMGEKEVLEGLKADK